MRIIFLLVLSLMTANVLAEDGIQSQAFSGVNSFVPFSARIPIYKVKAEFNRTTSSAAKLSNSNSLNFSNVTGANDCSISLGNLITDTRSSATNFGQKDITVYVDGDIVNASDCGRL